MADRKSDDAKGRPECATCGAAASIPCRSKSGRIVRAHWSRVVATVDARHAELARDLDKLARRIDGVERRLRLPVTVRDEPAAVSGVCP